MTIPERHHPIEALVCDRHRIVGIGVRMGHRPRRSGEGVSHPADAAVPILFNQVRRTLRT